MKPGSELLVTAAELLAPLNRELVFLGGATVHLHIDDVAAAPVRSTKDVDVVVAVVSYAEFTEIEAELRRIGFEQSLHSDDAPICRWSKEGLQVDVMPTKPEYIGFSKSEWFAEGFANAKEIILENGRTIAVFDVLHLIAVKVEAFADRGEGDLYASQDFEDIATVLDGNTEIWTLLSANNAVARFVRDWLRTIESEDLTSAIAGHVNSYPRAELLVDRIAQLPR